MRRALNRMKWFTNPNRSFQGAPARTIRRTRLHLEGLEDRLALNGQSILLPPGQADSSELLSLLHNVQVPLGTIADSSFDIRGFTADLTNITSDQIFDMGGLRFYSTGSRSAGTNTVTFGSSSSPAWTLVGLPGPTIGTYTPLLLMYGSTQLSFGTGLDNQITWTDGLYTVRNQTAGTAIGGFQISSGSGSFYATDLLSTGGTYSVVSIGTDGTVITTSASSFQVGQAVQFTGLENANGVYEATTYYVVNTDENHPTNFVISETPSGNPLSGASASNGKVKVDATMTLDVTSIVNGIVTTSQPNGYVTGQQIIFQQLNGASGGITNGTAYYVVSTGSTPSANTFGISDTLDGTPLAVSANSATVTGAADLPVSVQSIANGIVTLNAQNTFSANQAIRFSNLINTSGVSNGTTYYVSFSGSIQPNQFLISQTPGGAVLTSATASTVGSAGVSPDLSISINVTSIADGIVTTQYPTGYMSGQAITFDGLNNASNLTRGGTYYVVYDPTTMSETQFGISLLPGGDVLEGADASGGTVTLTFSAAPGDKGALLSQTMAFSLVNPYVDMLTATGRMSFIPTRILLAPEGTGTAVNGPALLLTGNQSVGYKNGNFSFDVGGQDANQGKYLEISSNGQMSFVDSGSGQRDIVLTATLGAPAGQQPRSFTDLISGSVFANTPHLLDDGDYIVFTSLENPKYVKTGKPYLIKTVADHPDEFSVIDTGNPNNTLFSATGGTYVRAASLSITNGLVTTSVPHGFKPGDTVELLDLPSDSTIVGGQYFVLSTSTSTTFTFGNSLTSDQQITGNATSGLLMTPLYNLGGFSIGGSVNVQVQFATDTQPAQLNLGGQVSATYDNGNGISISGMGQLAAADNSAYGLQIVWDESGQAHVEDWAFAISGSINVNSSGDPSATTIFSGSVSGLTITSTSNSDGSEDIGVFGSLSVTIPKLNDTFTLGLGTGRTDGLVIHIDPQGSSSLTSMDLTAELDKIKPTASSVLPANPASSNTSPKLQLYGFVGKFVLNHASSETSFDISGQVTLGVGATDADANGNWASAPSLVSLTVSPGAMVHDKNGMHFDVQEGFEVAVALTGNFQVGPVGFVANGATIEVAWPQGDDLTVLISGEVIFPKLKGLTLALGSGNGGSGLTIDTKTGAWHLDGWRIVIPQLNLDAVKFENVSIGFTGGGTSTKPSDVSNWDLDITGTVRLMTYGKSKGMAISATLDFGEDDGQFYINSFGAQVRGLNPGIAIGDTGGFATDLGAAVNNLHTSDWSGSFLLGGNFGDQVTIAGKEYSLMQFTTQGVLTPGEFTLSGDMILVGGILGTLDTTLDFNWGINSYTIDIKGDFFDGLLTDEFRLQVVPNQDVTGLATASINIPRAIPIIGGRSLASGSAYFLASMESGVDSFLAVWGTFFDHWTAGVKVDMATGQASHIGGSDVNKLMADIPDSLKNRNYTTNYKYTPHAPTDEMILTGLADSDTSTDFRGEFRVTWDATGPATEVYVSVNGTSVQVWGTGVDTTKPIIDQTKGLQYLVESSSVEGDVLIEVSLTSSSDPYASLLPQTDFVVSLVSDDPQASDLTDNWSGSFSAPPPQISRIGITQPQGNALGDVTDDNPNNATISFDYRTADLGSTQVDLFYDFDALGYNGIKIGSIRGSDLTPPANPGDFATHTFTWDISELPVFPLHVYAVIHDAQHVPSLTNYATDLNSPTLLGSVVPHPQIYVGIDITNGGGSESELSNWIVTATKVDSAGILSLVNGVVTTSEAITLTIGQEIVFSGLQNPQNVVNDRIYYVANVNATNNTFTFAAEPGAPAIFSASADANSGTLYATDPSSDPYTGLTNSSGTISLNPNDTGAYRIEVVPKSVGFVVDTDPDDGPVPIVDSNGNIVRYVSLDSTSNEVNVGFNFIRQTTIAGRIYNDIANDGTRGASNPGAVGLTVYLDDNNNGVLDSGEMSTVTAPDGGYVFYPDITANYSTTIRQVAASGWNVVSPSSINVSNLSPGSFLFGNDFLNVQLLTFGGTVYHDINGNHSKDPGEPGIPNVTININGPSNGTTTTTADGTWVYSTKVRGNYTISASAPNGSTINAPFQAAPQLGIPSSNSFAVNTPFSSNTLAHATAIQSYLNPSTGNYDIYVGANWGSNSQNGTQNASIIKLNVDTNSGSVLWSQSTSSEGMYVSQFITGSSLGNPGLAFAVVDSINDFVASATQLIQINSDGTTNATTVTAGQKFAAWPHLGSSGGLVSVDPAGNVQSWSADSGYSPQYLGRVGGTIVDVTTFQAGTDKRATTPENIAVLTIVNGAAVVQIIAPDGTMGPVIGVNGIAWLSIVSGDFNADGIEDLAVLTTTTPLFESNVIPVPADYNVTFLINSGNGSFSQANFSSRDILVVETYAQNSPSPIRLATVNMPGTDGDQVVWTSLSSDADETTLHAMNVIGKAGGPFEVSQYSISDLLSDFTQTHALGNGTLVSLKGAFVGDVNQLVGYSVPVNSVLINTYTSPVEMNSAGGQWGGFDFGLSGTVTGGTGENLSGVVFNDTNGNGLHEYGEPGLGNYPVQIIKSNSVYAVTALTGDADSGVSPSKTYTHLLNFGGSSVTVNGVTFQAAQPSGSNYVMHSYDLPTGNLGDMQILSGNNTNVAGNIAGLMSEAYFSEQFGGEHLTLTGLIPGITYTTTFYGSGFGNAGQRVVTVYDSQGGQFVVDENQYGSDAGIMLKDTFTATGSSITFTFIPQNMVHPIPSFHLYGMSNEVAASIQSGSPVISQTVTTSDGSDGRAPGAYTVPLAPGAYYARTVASAGANLGLDGQFSFISAQMSDSLPASLNGNAVVLVANLQGNGMPNLAVLSGTTIQVRLIKSDGTVYYETYETGLTAISTGTPTLLAADITGDGNLDLIVSGNGGIAILKSIGLGQFAQAKTYLATELAGKDALVAVSPGQPGNPGTLFASARVGTSTFLLQWNSGTAEFDAGPTITTAAAEQLAVGDVDSDGSFDIVVYDGTNVHTYSGEGYSQNSVIGTFATTASDAKLIVAGLRLNFPQSVLLARRADGNLTLSLMQANTNQNYIQQDIVVGIDTSASPLWIATGDFADDNNNQLDVAVGSGTVMQLYRNFGVSTSPLVLISAAGQVGLPITTQGFVTVQMTPGAPDDLISLDASGSLTAWQNLVHAALINANGTPIGQDIPVDLPGGSGGTLYGSVWLDADNTGSWSADDIGFSAGVTAYIDVNNNGQVDSGEPTATPSLSGQFAFKQVKPGTYMIRLLLGAYSDGTSSKLSWPTTDNGAITLTLPNFPLASAYGADFGITVPTVSSDFNADGAHDLLLTNPLDNSIHVQLHHGTSRLATQRIGVLPGNTWSVAGVADFNNDGVPDILLQDSTTRSLRVWQMKPGMDRTQINTQYDLSYKLPKGFAVTAVGDENGDNEPDLILRNMANGDHRLVLINTSTHGPVNITERAFALPNYLQVVGHGDLNGDGLGDLLVRDARNGHLVARLRQENNKADRMVDLGKPNSDWLVAGVTNLTGGKTQDDIFFQEGSTGKGYVWQLNAQGRLANSKEVEIGEHDDLRLHLAEQNYAKADDAPFTYQNGVLTITSTTSVKISLQYLERLSNFHNEFGIIRLDNADGMVGGLLPVQAGYAQKAMATSRSRILFSRTSKADAQTSITLLPGNSYMFYLVQDTSSSLWRVKNPKNLTSKKVTFFSIEGANPDKTNHVYSTIDAANAQGILHWEDQTRGGDRDFNDAVIRIIKSGTTPNIATNSAPALNSAFNARLTEISEDTVTNPGNTIAEIVGNSISDKDVANSLGIAVYAADNRHGQWQYSFDNGFTWINLSGVSRSTARLLSMETRLRFVPNPNHHDKSTISYRAWDQTAGTLGGTANVGKATLIGGRTAFSKDTDQAYITVTPVNDAPEILDGWVYHLASVNENTSASRRVQVGTLLGKSVTDADAGAKRGIAITAADAVVGTWQYSTNGGKSWSSLLEASQPNAHLLRSSDYLRFIPNKAGEANLTYHAWDQTNGAAGAYADLTELPALQSAFSTDEAFARMEVKPVAGLGMLQSGLERIGHLQHHKGKHTHS